MRTNTTTTTTTTTDDSNNNNNNNNFCKQGVAWLTQLIATAVFSAF
jgi:hypothetical protein